MDNRSELRCLFLKKSRNKCDAVIFIQFIYFLNNTFIAPGTEPFVHTIAKITFKSAPSTREYRNNKIAIIGIRYPQ